MYIAKAFGVAQMHEEIGLTTTCMVKSMLLLYVGIYLILNLYLKKNRGT